VFFRTGDNFLGKNIWENWTGDNFLGKNIGENWTGEKILSEKLDGQPRIIARPFIQAGVY